MVCFNSSKKPFKFKSVCDSSTVLSDTFIYSNHQSNATSKFSDHCVAVLRYFNGNIML